MNELETIVNFLDNVKQSKLANDVLEVFGNHAQSFEQFDELSRVFFKIKNYERSIYYGEKALSISSTSEQMYTIRHNLINVYNHANDPKKALRYIRANENVIDNDNDRDFEKAYSLFLSNKKSDAAKLLRSKLNDETLTEEQLKKLKFNLGTYDLLEGKLQEGLNGFLVAGENMGIMNQRHDSYGLPRWNGIIKPGLKLLIVAEAGIGDEVINVRFFNDIISYGIDAIWLTLQIRKDLCEIFNLNGIKSYYSINQIPKDFLDGAYYTPSMQLPINLNCNYKDLWKGNYLSTINQQYKDKWKTIIDCNELKIGLRWQGNPSYDQDLHRSIPLKGIINSININSKLYSIQRDNGLEELEEFKTVQDLSKELETLHDLFACIDNLDLVITSCTSVAHIAAAMGKEVCILVPISCYYVWCNLTKETPWYGNNVHVFYQQEPRCWKEPLLELTNFLNNNFGV